MKTWFATIRTQTCPAVVKERGGGVASERGVKADGGSGPLTLGEALDNRGHVADRVVAGHSSHPPRLAKAGDTKKAPGLLACCRAMCVQVPTSIRLRCTWVQWDRFPGLAVAVMSTKEGDRHDSYWPVHLDMGIITCAPAPARLL